MDNTLHDNNKHASVHHPAPVHHTKSPSTFYQTVDLITKLLTSLSLLGILIIMAMILVQLKKTGGDLDDIITSLTATFQNQFNGAIRVDLGVGDRQQTPLYFKAVQ